MTALNTNQATRLLDHAKAWVAWHRPYYSSILFALQEVWTVAVPTAAVDQRWRLYLNTEWIAKHSTAELAGVLVHEINHVARRHHERTRDRDRTLWNLAGDYEINPDLVRDGLKLPGDCAMPNALGLPDHLSAEVYYKWLLKKARKAVAEEVEGVTSGNCGACAGGDHAGGKMRDAARSAKVEGLPVAEREVTLDRFANDVANSDKKYAGTIPGRLKRWANERFQPVLNWRTLLRSAICGATQLAKGYARQTYTRPNRRYPTNPGDMVMPSWVEPVVETAVVIDTSASMSTFDLNIVVGEVQGILTALRSPITVVCCDTEAYDPHTVQSASHIQFTGGGGTDLEEGIRVCDTMRPLPDLIIVLTDGFTPWPDRPPKAKTLIGILKDDNYSPPDVPAWAQRVNIPVGDI